jgi:hypothetical protein
MEFALVLAVPVVAYLVSRNSRWRPVRVFLLVYSACIILFFGSLAFGSRQFSSFIVSRQHSFLNLKGTAFKLDPLHSSIKSFLHVLPQAVKNSFLRPWFWESKNMLQLFYSIEVIVFVILALLAVLFRQEEWKKRLTNPVILLLFSFSISLYVLVGYTVPFPGAIIRYKCIPELLLVCCFIILTDYKKIKAIILKIF